MGRNVQASRVYQTVKHNLGSTLNKNTAGVVPPPWLKALENIPPSEIMTRPYAVQHKTPNPRATKPKRLFKPTHIVYPEDQLRKEFYKDHPWELARPRIIMELDGEDHKYLDWSKGLRQRGMQLSGEWYGHICFLVKQTEALLTRITVSSNANSG
jgi:small subunit ribosomal protein S23